MFELTTKEEVQTFIEQNQYALIFKAGSCRQTEQAKRRLNPFFKKYQEFPSATIDVVNSDEASSIATAMSGKKHESPQILLFKDRKCVFEANHWRIEAVTLIDAVESCLNANGA